MTEKNLLNQLEDLKVPMVETPIYKEKLKKALLAVHENRQSKQFIIPNFFNMKNFAPISILAIALVTGTIVGTSLLSSQVASAKDLIDKAIAQVEHSKMPVEQQQKVLEVLKQAKQAKDLKYLGENENPIDGKVKSLSYTDSLGKAVKVELDEDDAENPVNLEEQDKTEIETKSVETEKAESKDGETGEDEKAKTVVPTTTPATTVSASSTTAKTPEVEVKDSSRSGVVGKKEVESEDKVEIKAPEVKGTETSTTKDSNEVEKD